MISPIQLTPDMDMGTLVNAVNNNFRQVEAENRTKIIKDEEGVNRIFIGRMPDGSYVIQVSKNGVDVLTADPDDMIFSSNSNLFKIVESGSVDMNMPSVANGQQSPYVSSFIEHDLDYSPLVIAFITMPNPQQPGMDVTRMFGSGSVQARSVSTSGVTIGYLSDEAVEVTPPVGGVKGRVSFRWRVANASGFAEPSVAAKIKYFLLTETVS